MPKETIRADGFNVEISWGKGMQSVQMATTVPDATRRILEQLHEAGYAAVPLEYLDDCYAVAGRISPGGPSSDSYDPSAIAEKIEAVGPLFSGWYATLDRREQVNRVIRTMQLARDGAFGKDA
jgi:hypothetical protein